MLSLFGKLLILAALGAGIVGVSTNSVAPVDGDLPTCDSYCRVQCDGRPKSCWNECRASGACS